MDAPAHTNTEAYADYLIRHQHSLVSRLLQIPYRAHLRALDLGRTLDVGCGAGRNLKALSAGSLGIDHNPRLVEACLKWNLQAMTTGQWLERQEGFRGAFDSILFSHVAEHMTSPEFQALLQSFFPSLKPGARAVVICPQEAGYASDPTHVEFMDGAKLCEILDRAGFERSQCYSFPFPRAVGKVFKQNETVVIGVLKERD